MRSFLQQFQALLGRMNREVTFWIIFILFSAGEENSLSLQVTKTRSNTARTKMSSPLSLLNPQGWTGPKVGGFPSFSLDYPSLKIHPLLGKQAVGKPLVDPKIRRRKLLLCPLKYIISPCSLKVMSRARLGCVMSVSVL